MLSALFPYAVGTSDLDAMTREVDRFLQRTAPIQPSRQGAAPLWPGVNIWRSDDTVVAEAELPGFTVEDVEVHSSETTLTLRGRRSLTVPEGATALRVERCATTFERTVELPIPIRPDAVEATLTNGVLRVSMPIAEAVRPRRVAVKAVSPESRPAAPHPAALLEGSAPQSLHPTK